MTNQTTDGVANLPPLPEPLGSAEIRTAEYFDDKGKQVGYTTEEVDAFTAEQMTAYALEALRLASPQGWKLVPMSATPEMCVAGVKRMFEDKQYSAAWEDVYSNVWRAMLAAAPPALAQAVPALVAPENSK